MANLCCYELNAVGRKECIDYLVNVLNAHYNYTKNEFNFKEHVYRNDVSDYEIDNCGMMSHIQLWGECAWSVLCCMIDNKHSELNRIVSLQELSKRYGLYIEIWSEEPGIGFKEHFKIINGNLIINECHDMNTHIIAGFNNYNEYVKDCEEYNMQPMPKEQFDYYLSVGECYVDLNDKNNGYLTFADNCTRVNPNYLCKIDLCKLINKDKN